MWISIFCGQVSSSDNGGLHFWMAATGCSTEELPLGGGKGGWRVNPAGVPLSLQIPTVIWHPGHLTHFYYQSTLVGT